MDNKHLRILIVDDKDSWSRFAQQTLSSAGFSVIVNQEISNTRNGRLRNYLDGFDLIILDLIKAQQDSMNILNETCQSNTPKLAVTSNPTIPIIREAMKNGANNISAKPYDKESLLQMVKDNLKH